MLVLSSSFNRMICYFANNLGCWVSRCIIYEQSHISTDEVNYLTSRGSMISYLPAGREHKVNDEGRWVRDGRQEGKPARVIRKLFTEEKLKYLDIKDEHFEKFSNLFSAYVNVHGDGDDRPPSVKLVVCNGEFISEFYSRSGLSDNAGGNLTNSCMIGKHESIFDIYTMNDKQVNMVAAIDEDHKILGRALLWHTDNMGMCMDTIYAADSIKPMFIDFAIKNNMHYKSSQSCHHSYFDMFNDKSVGYKTTEVTLEFDEHDEYPYLDTLQYYDTDNDMLTNKQPENYREYRSTSGDFEESSSYVYDEISGENIDRDDAVYIDYERPNGRWVSCDTHRDNVVTDIRCNYVLEDDCIYYRGNYYLKTHPDVCWVDSRDEYYHIDEVVFDEYSNAIHEEDAVQLRNGEYVYDYDAQVLYDGTYVLESDAVRMYNGKYAHEDEVCKLSDGQYALQNECVEMEDGTYELEDEVDEYEGVYFKIN